ncbi:catechol 2,3-dioxygenase-like lactoylglutathione lyase family enzyme [Nocardioides sp. BE266]|uniref:VOC family protein n=1 Tax=Nocardioides sp. BE266 TaxID=2817725 RepID=UPI002865DBFC|nr:VOC family protein [Nocardioides sp. BE266]MDR7252473.1 catechol 2,3-dioxygenase-like lactoylglutathione lyase family enzyme [Nocardioides sp. BE266]
MSLTKRSVAMMMPVTDIDRSRTFYSESLGLDYTGTNDEGSAIYALEGGSTLVLLPRPDSTPSESTALSFEVDDIHSEIRDLKGRGVVFEDYDLPDFSTVDHVCVLGAEMAAWFKDPDGNVLCLHQDT